MDDGEAATNGDITLLENQTAALREAGGYTAVWKMEFTKEGESVGVTEYTHAVDYENERSSFTMLITNEDEVNTDYESYQADGVSFARYGSGEEATYQVNDAAFAPENTLFAVQSSITDVDDLADFEVVGAETYDGVTVTRYELTHEPSWIASQSPDEEFTWTTFTYTVLVDQDGLIRLESWGGEGVDDDGVDHTMEFSYSLTNIGATSVEEPEWIDTAREQAEQ